MEEPHTIRKICYHGPTLITSRNGAAILDAPASIFTSPKVTSASGKNNSKYC